jgi:hypothetical protein
LHAAHVPGFFNFPIGQAADTLGADCIIKIFHGQVQPLKQILPAGCAHGQCISLSPFPVGVRKVKFVFPSPEGLTSINQCLELSRCIVKKNRGSGDNDVGFSEQRIYLVLHIVINRTNPFFFTKNIFHTGFYLFLTDLDHLRCGAQPLGFFQKFRKQKPGVPLFSGASLKSKYKHVFLP